MIRQTSRDAYNTIKENGLLSKRRLEVYIWMYDNGPASAQNMYQELCAGNTKNPSSYLSRLSELRSKGVMQEIGTKTCEHTGRTVILWDVTDKLPLPREKKSQLDVLLEKERKTKNELISLGMKIARIKDKDFRKRQIKLL